jgi:hypothetical protein
VFGKWLRGGDKCAQRRGLGDRSQHDEHDDILGGRLHRRSGVGNHRPRRPEGVWRNALGCRHHPDLGRRAAQLPTSDGTAEVGEIIAENTTATSADISFGTKSLVAYKYSSKVVAVPFELLQDSNVDVEAFVRKRLATRLGRITNTHFTTGTGSSQPNGVVTAATTGYTCANSTTQVTTVPTAVWWN